MPIRGVSVQHICHLITHGFNVSVHDFCMMQVPLDMRLEQQQHQYKDLESGEVLVTLLPVNEKLPWITPARFRPELVPEELMAPSLTVR